MKMIYSIPGEEIPKKINFGCGNNLRKGYLNIDSDKIVNTSGNIIKLNNVTYSFPSSAPTLNQVLSCTNATGGILGWVDSSGGASLTASNVFTNLNTFEQNIIVGKTGVGANDGKITFKSQANAYDTILTFDTTRTATRTFYFPNSNGTLATEEYVGGLGFLTSSTEGWRTTDVTSLAASLTNTAGVLSVVSAPTATNLAGGGAYYIPYQTSAGVTSMLAPSGVSTALTYTSGGGLAWLGYTNSNTASTLAWRDSNGDFSARYITASKFIGTADGIAGGFGVTTGITTADGNVEVSINGTTYKLLYKT